jgi:protein-S-isoprenylcysteine O-methyltransferase Ste14
MWLKIAVFIACSAGIIIVSLRSFKRKKSHGFYRFFGWEILLALIFLAWGAFLKDVNWITLILAMGATFFLITGALQEERENLEYFGEDYRAYMERTKRFVPYII